MNLSLRTALAAATFLACASSQAATLIGLNSQGQLARIDTANIAGAMNTDITGLMAGDRLVGIDTRPKDGKIYGVSLANQLYTVDEMTGAASWVAALSAPVIQANLGYGIDFNPVADFGTGASLRLVSSAGDNFAINAATGVVGNAANKIAAGYTAVGYTNTTLKPAAAPASTALYYIDSNTDMLAMAPAAFNTPTITLVGALGVDAADDAVVCMPGTHSKWVRTNGGTVERFATFMTGELFDVVSRETILSHAVTGADQAEDIDAFKSAVIAAFETPAFAANLLFQVRSGQLLYGGKPSSGWRARSGPSATLRGADGGRGTVASEVTHRHRHHEARERSPGPHFLARSRSPKLRQKWGQLPRMTPFLGVLSLKSAEKPGNVGNGDQSGPSGGGGGGPSIMHV